MTNTFSNSTAPAYIRTRYTGKCRNPLCQNPFIGVGSLAFYIKDGNQLWHGKCGQASWKATGTPYHQRCQAAAFHKTNGSNHPPIIKETPAASDIDVGELKPNYLDHVRAALFIFKMDIPIPKDCKGRVDQSVIDFMVYEGLIYLEGEFYLITDKGKTYS